MQAARNASTAAERARLSRRCNDVIALGERIKANQRAAVASSRPPVPESTRPLSTLEKTIILRASRLHGNIFPPWESPPDPTVFSDLGPGGDAYVCVSCANPISLSTTLTRCSFKVIPPHSLFPPSSKPSSPVGNVQSTSWLPLTMENALPVLQVPRGQPQPLIWLRI